MSQLLEQFGQLSSGAVKLQPTFCRPQSPVCMVGPCSNLGPSHTGLPPADCHLSGLLLARAVPASFLIGASLWVSEVGAADYTGLYVLLLHQLYVYLEKYKNIYTSCFETLPSPGGLSFPRNRKFVGIMYSLNKSSWFPLILLVKNNIIVELLVRSKVPQIRVGK